MPTAQGTVTFLFTDIEGSTRLMERDLVAAQEAIARHDEVMHEAMERHGGDVFRTEGDAFCVVFGDSRLALLAALDAGRALRGVPLRVRMALHTGNVEFREKDFFGLPLNRVKRLLSIAHGGQILLSQAVHALVQDYLPPEASLFDLGLHHLKDLQRPEHVYALVHPALESDFPPLLSLDGRPNNLPHQPTSFVGREREVDANVREIRRTPLLTLVGPGGCGKTRLALQVAKEAIDGFSGGVWLVELASLSNPQAVPLTVASVLGVREAPGRTLVDALANVLTAAPTLLVLDNCEHLLDACASLAARLLRTCPDLRILSTSQEPLGIAGETVRRVPPLEVPSGDDLPTVVRTEATRLFIDRAAAVHEGFVLDEATAPAVALVCRRLDGLPLALELAASQMGAVGIEEMARRVEAQERFSVLRQGDPTKLPRHRTLASMIDWSHERLSESEAALFRRLAVFAGGWTAESAEAVCGQETTLVDIVGLVRKSLVITESRRGEVRYRFLETIRHYALARLRESGEEARFRIRHRDYFLNLAERAETGMASPDVTIWLDRFEANLDNLRAAFKTCLDDDEGTELGLRLVGSLWRFWRLRGDLSEGREWFRDALARKGGATAARARALFGAGALALHQDDYEEARHMYEACREIYEIRDDMAGLGDSLHGLGRVASAFGNYEAARDLYGKALDKRRLVGDELGQAATLNNLGLVALETGDLESADRLLMESFGLETRLGNVVGVANSLGNLAATALARGDDEAACGFAERALSLHEQSGNRVGTAEARRYLAEVRRRCGELEAAYQLCEASLSTYLSLGDRRAVAELFDLAAPLMLDLGDSPAAACLMGTAEALRESFGWRLPPVERPSHDALRHALDAAMGSEAFEAALQEGRRMSPQEAFARTFSHTLSERYPATDVETPALDRMDR